MDADASSATHRAAYETSRATNYVDRGRSSRYSSQDAWWRGNAFNATAIVESGLDSKTGEMLMGHLAMFQQDEEWSTHSLLRKSKTTKCVFKPGVC